MELLALLLIVALITLVWIAVVPDEEETAPALLHTSPNDFALELARQAARRRNTAPAASVNGFRKVAGE
jgi:hypothetical protein